MGGGGGGGKPYFRFSSSSSYSTVVCNPDPENPGQQICKKVVKNTSIDPDTGKRTVRNIESEESRPISNGFGAFSIFGRSGNAVPSISN